MADDDVYVYAPDRCDVEYITGEGVLESESGVLMSDPNTYWEHYQNTGVVVNAESVSVPFSDIRDAYPGIVDTVDSGWGAEGWGYGDCIGWMDYKTQYSSPVRRALRWLLGDDVDQSIDLWDSNYIEEDWYVWVRLAQIDACFPNIPSPGGENWLAAAEAAYNEWAYYIINYGSASSLQDAMTAASAGDANDPDDVIDFLYPAFSACSDFFASCDAAATVAESNDNGGATMSDQNVGYGNGGPYDLVCAMGNGLFDRMYAMSLYMSTW